MKDRGLTGLALEWPLQMLHVIEQGSKLTAHPDFVEDKVGGVMLLGSYQAMASKNEDAIAEEVATALSSRTMLRP